MPQNSIFPHSPFGLSSSYSRDDIQIDGMKVKFDKVADLVPAELTRTDGQAGVLTASSFGFDKDTCTIYIVATPEFVASLEGMVESKSGYVASIRNYVEDIYQKVNGLSNFKVKVVDSLQIAGFQPLLDVRVYLKSSGGNRTYNYSNANVNAYFLGAHNPNRGGQQPSSAHGAAYLVAHEALHSYLIRLGVLLFAGALFLSEDGGGHTTHYQSGKRAPNLNLEGQHVTASDTFTKDFQRIDPVQLYFLKEYTSYIHLTHPKFSLAENQKRIGAFKERQNAILMDSAADMYHFDTPGLFLPSLGKNITESNAHIDFKKNPATIPFR